MTPSELRQLDRKVAELIDPEKTWAWNGCQSCKGSAQVPVLNSHDEYLYALRCPDCAGKKIPLPFTTDDAAFGKLIERLMIDGFRAGIEFWLDTGDGLWFCRLNQRYLTKGENKKVALALAVVEALELLQLTRIKPFSAETVADILARRDRFLARHEKEGK